MASKSTPKKFGILIFPGFEPLDAFGPLEALVMLSRKHQLELYMISVLDTLSPVSTAPPSSVYNPLNSSAFVSLVPTHTIASPPADLDVLLVPGGWGIEGPDIVPAIPWLASIQPTLNHALIGVCNGVSLLARAGILNGRRATTNKSLWDELIALGPTTEWDKDARWVKDGKVWTSAGVSAGIDATLAYIADTFGAELVRWITNVMEYERKEEPKPDRFALVDYNEFNSR